jgi:hypothetical protein
LRYADYDKRIYSENDIMRYKAIFEKDILDKATELSEFIKRANERVKLIKEWECNKKYSVLGHLNKNGREKEIMLIIRYEDGTQREERYSFNKIRDVRLKLVELKETYTGVDWSKFEEEIY